MLECNKEKVVEITIPKVYYLGNDHTKANANEGDVLKGKTFYSGKTKYMRTGTFDPDVNSNQISNYTNLVLNGGSNINSGKGLRDQVEIENLQKIILGEA